MDFTRESSNMKRVKENLWPMKYEKSEALRFQVDLANVIDSLSTKKMLVMSYIDGITVNKKQLLEERNADKDMIIRYITQAYAHQIFVDGFYSGDPHPGNILIDSKTMTPVLLDFGLTKELPQDVKVNFARMLVAADESDIYGLLQALEGIGT